MRRSAKIRIEIQISFIHSSLFPTNYIPPKTQARQNLRVSCFFIVPAFFRLFSLMHPYCSASPPPSTSLNVHFFFFILRLSSQTVRGTTTTTSVHRDLYHLTVSLHVLTRRSSRGEIYTSALACSRAVALSTLPRRSRPLSDQGKWATGMMKKELLGSAIPAKALYL